MSVSNALQGNNPRVEAHCGKNRMLPGPLSLSLAYREGGFLCACSVGSSKDSVAVTVTVRVPLGGGGHKKRKR